MPYEATGRHRRTDAKGVAFETMAAGRAIKVLIAPALRWRIPDGTNGISNGSRKVQLPFSGRRRTQTPTSISYLQMPS